MNRVIKFRGKNIGTGHWHYGFLIGIIDPTKEEDVYREWGIHSGVNIAPISWVIPSTVGQFTGLYDNDGKEIYEGDAYQVAGNKIYVVKFLQGVSNHELYTGMFGLWLSDDVFFNFDEFALENGKVIGNIHDNPELIKQ